MLSVIQNNVIRPAIQATFATTCKDNPGLKDLVLKAQMEAVADFMTITSKLIF